MSHKRLVDDVHYNLKFWLKVANSIYIVYRVCAIITNQLSVHNISLISVSGPNPPVKTP